MLFKKIKGSFNSLSCSQTNRGHFPFSSSTKILPRTINCGPAHPQLIYDFGPSLQEISPILMTSPLNPIFCWAVSLFLRTIVPRLTSKIIFLAQLIMRKLIGTNISPKKSLRAEFILSKCTRLLKPDTLLTKTPRAWLGLP